MTTELIDWTVLTEDVMEIVEQAARKVADTYSGVVMADDLQQEGFILCATNAGKVTDYLALGPDAQRYLYRWIWSRLTDIARREASVTNRQVSIQSMGSEGE